MIIALNRLWKKNKTLGLDENLNEDTVRYASIPDRIKAAIIDSIILIVIMYFISELFTLFDSVPNYVKIVISVIIFLLYDPLMTSFYGGTVGHTISKITVRKDGNLNSNISFPIALIRFLLKASLGWISLLTISGDKKKKAIHDNAANSVIVMKYKR
nr:RDD family protein [Hyunsoonleella ulvae]